MEQRHVTVRDGGRIGVRVYRSSASGMLPLVVNFHGGGWVLGSLAMAESVCSRLAAALPAVVVSVDYRLAPEHRFPTALHDAYDATVWAHANADEFGADASRLAVMGDSAGGNLAAGVTLLARGKGPRIGAQELLYPALDLTLGSPSMAENAHAPVLTRSHMRAYRDHYLGPRGDPEDPLASPLLADDLSGLPPALIQTAQFDPLRDDGARYAARMSTPGSRSATRASTARRTVSRRSRACSVGLRRPSSSSSVTCASISNRSDREPGRGQTDVAPRSTGSATPVTVRDSSEASQSTASAMSRGVASFGVPSTCPNDAR